MNRNAAVGLFAKPSKLKSAGYGIFLITSKVVDARRRGATIEAYGAIRRRWCLDGGSGGLISL